MATYRTAMGKAIDIDTLRVANESVIAVGNMRTNARGDELGAGGQVVKTRAQVMQEYHKLNTPVVAHHDDVVDTSIDVVAKVAPKPARPIVEEVPITTSSTPSAKPRGSFADAVAKTTEVTQVLLDPLPGVTPGVKRI